jgi:hypothetical protein
MPRRGVSARTFAGCATRGLTPVRLADATDLSHLFLSRMERGLAQPRLASLRRCRLLVVKEGAAEAGTRRPQTGSTDPRAL